MPRDLMGSVLNAELTIARAASAARRGDLAEADRLLCDIDATAGPNPAQLNLLARVHAQRGRFADADECWARVQAVDPKDVNAAAGRARVAAIEAGWSSARPILSAGRVAAAAAVVCVLAGGAVIWATTTGQVPSAGSAASAADGASSADDAVRADALAQQLAALQAERSDASSRLAAEINALARDLTIPGVRVGHRPDSVEVVFDEGLFVRSDRLTADGAAMLTALGERLSGRDVTITVVGHAVVVSGGPDRGGSVVALARALVAARALAESSGAPLTAFTLATADQAESPSSEPSRNRTVTLVVTPVV